MGRLKPASTHQLVIIHDECHRCRQHPKRADQGQCFCTAACHNHGVLQGLRGTAQHDTIQHARLKMQQCMQGGFKALGYSKAPKRTCRIV